MPKYTIKNGIYMKDGKPVFALGVSYYASYHERKVPVPPEADRLGEAEADISDMSKFGFNIVRCAALGDVYYNADGEVVTDTPLLDRIAELCEENDIGLMLRLQGYSMNISGYDDTLMIDQDGNPMDKRRWYDFVRDCLFHEGLNNDNDKGTAALAKHFVKYPSAVGWQTYNEPHYPSSGMFDYHPKTIAAYRKWLVERGYKTEDEARDFDPPRKHPAPDADPVEWIRWRTFSHGAMTDFLCHSSDVAKAASGLETMTCITSGPTQAYHPLRGEDFFGISEGMDALGMTQYYVARKPEAYVALMNLSLAESAASAVGVPMWIIEYDAKTKAPSDYFARNTYLAIGTGIKGLLYYQWRGDHVYPDSPEGNGFGILNYDRSKTVKYDTAKRIVAFLNANSDLLMSASRHRTGIGILRSFHGFTYADAKDNYGHDTGPLDKGIRNSWLEAERAFFTEMAKRGIVADFTRAEDLKENKLGIKILFIPQRDYISDEENTLIEEFGKNGGITVTEGTSASRWLDHVYATETHTRTNFNSFLDVSDLCTLLDVKSVVAFAENEETLILETLDIPEGYLAVVTNVENIPTPAKAPTLTVPTDIRRAVLLSFDSEGETELEVKDGRVALPKIGDGCFVKLIK